MLTIIRTRLLFTLILLLLASGTALAQNSGATAKPAVKKPQFEWFKQKDYHFAAMLPLGGKRFTAQELEIDAIDDPMDYLLIWMTDDLNMPFNMVMFGALDAEEEISEEDFRSYFDSFMSNVSGDFPYLQQEVDAVELHDRTWKRFILADEGGSMMINYLSHEGNIFYSASFLSGPTVEIPIAINTTTSQLDLMFLEGDTIPREEDMEYPRFFY